MPKRKLPREAVDLYLRAFKSPLVRREISRRIDKAVASATEPLIATIHNLQRELQQSRGESNG